MILFIIPIVHCY